MQFNPYMDIEEMQEFLRGNNNARDLPVDFDKMDPSSAEWFKRMHEANPNLPIPTIVTEEEVKSQAKDRLTHILQDWRILREVIKRHEATTQKRWAKKTRNQRLKILLDAWPGPRPLPTNHRPDFEAFRNETMEERRGNGGTRFRQEFLWPYLNQEDLCKPRSLPLLLNSRARHSPADFAGTDAENQFAFTSEAVIPPFLNCYTMMLNGFTEENIEGYGQLISWDENEDAFDWCISQKQFQPGEGLITLEVQQQLMRYLVNCCRQILHDIPEETWTSDVFPIQPEPPMKEESETAGFESLAVLAAEAPYRLPSKLDLAKIESLLAARTSAAEDRLWSMREDPVYFFEQLTDAKEHRHEMIKDRLGRVHHTVTDPRRHDVFMSRVLMNSLLEVFLEIESFAELQRQAHDLRLMQAKYADRISPNKDLPSDYMRALVKFRWSLERAIKDHLRQLQIVGPAAPPFRHLFTREVPTDLESSKMRIMSRQDSNESKVVQNLRWLFNTLWENSHTLYLIGMPLVVDELERLVETEPEAMRLISPVIASEIGDLSILAQCMRQIELYQPWARCYSNVLAQEKEQIEKEYAEATKSWASFVAAMKHPSILRRSVPLVRPFESKFPYPIDKRPTKANVEALRRAEANLDAFWASIDEILYTVGGDLSSTATRRLLTQPRILQRTPEWIEPEPRESKSSKKGPDPSLQVEALFKPLSALYFERVGTKKSDLITTHRPAKVKRKGASAQAEAVEGVTASAVPEPAVTQYDVQPALAVDARALKVFRTLFFNPDVTSSPGEIPWADFLHAMTSVGFLAHKLYGSVWQFQPTLLDVERPIQFHEPHPKGKIPFQVARRHGRRLQRAYGWFGGMFVLKSGK